MTFATQDEIVSRIHELKDTDIFGFQANDLLQWLDYVHAKPMLSPKMTPEKWAELKLPFDSSAERVVEEIRNYMPFAWEKANDCRGLSAMRSIMHLEAWLWIMGERQAAERLSGFTHYGKPQLRAICEHFGIDWIPFDNAVWKNDEEEEGGAAMPAAPLWAGPDLEGENARLREALAPFANLALYFDDQLPDNTHLLGSVTVSDIRRARLVTMKRNSR